MHVNLLPHQFVWRRLFRKRIRQWMCAFGFVGVTILGINFSLLERLWMELFEIQTIHSAAEPMRALQADRFEIAKRSVGLSQKIKQLQAAVSHDRTNSLLGIISHGVIATNGAVQIQEMQVSLLTSEGTVRNAQISPNSSRSSLSPETKTTGNQYQMTLRGISIESESITTFMESLQKSNLFPMVELKSTQERYVLERSLQEFQLECLAND
ncbi:MAG: PilN domain-containing protein [Planctomycetota bacterium]|nr:PilN domain-containing protein [Planctomycetota bacterium]